MGSLRIWLESLIELVAPPRCAACDLPLHEDEVGFCGGCVLLIDRIGGSPAAYAFGGPLADAIRAVKYGGRTERLPALRALLEEPARAHLGRVDAVVPVPLHRARLRERGFDHVALLGAHLAKTLGVPVQLRRLRRTRCTPPQAGLAAADRARNVRGAFEAMADPGRPRVLLFDDVCTTGATLEAAAEALGAAGATHVRRMALAGTDRLQ